MDHGRIIARGTPRELVASLGVEHVVELSTAEGQLPEAAGFHRVDGVREVEIEPGTVRMQAAELHRVVPAVLAELARQGLPLTELRTRSATLEDVFVALTGRHLRDE
jgi:ABC-2 type transport system ATP-binding protein